MYYKCHRGYSKSHAHKKAGIIWQEEIIPFFEGVTFSEDADTPVACYTELADEVEDELVRLDEEYFSELAEAMRIWATYWRDDS